MGALVWGLTGAVVGAGAGVAIRRLLAGLPRGTRVRPGVAESLGAVLLGIGSAVIQGTAPIGAVTLAGLLTVALGLVDAAEHRLPDALTLPGLLLALATVLLTALAAPGSGSLLRAALVAGVLALAFGLAHLASPRSLGRGDVKLIPSLGLLTGYFSIPIAVVALVAAFGAGAVVALGGIATRRLSRKSAIPFGPFLLLGAWLALAVPALGQALTVS